jgi:hypothetical protein
MASNPLDFLFGQRSVQDLLWLDSNKRTKIQESESSDNGDVSSLQRVDSFGFPLQRIDSFPTLSSATPNDIFQAVSSLPLLSGSASPRSAASNQANHHRANVMGATSIQIFRRHLVLRADGTYNASGINSLSCFNDWIAHRSSEKPMSQENLQKTFQRILTCHITGSDGRQPFSPAEEDAILRILRQKRIWPAFSGTNSNIGHRGFRTLGYHEKKQQKIE